MDDLAKHTTPPTDGGVQIRRIRKGLGLTQSQFAERLGVTPITVHRWESGQSRPQRLAKNRLRELENVLATESAPASAATTAPLSAVPLDFAGNPDAISAVAEAVRLSHGYQFNPAFATEISRIAPLPHQRIAVYERMIPQQPLRFLLADDAGAGKTIMTGLYVREMLSRRRIRRVLVVPPAGLVGNWERELRTLFRLRFRIVSGADAPRNAPGRAAAANPFRGPESDLVVVSLDTLTGERTFDALRQPDVSPYDLVVFDEAHKLSVVEQQHGVRKRRRYELAEALAGCPGPKSRYARLGWSAQHLLLLTATPHMGRDTPYHYLWRLLDPRVFSTGEAFRRFPREARDSHFIRRTKEEMVGLDGMPLFRRRACDTFSYALSPGPDGEQALYDATTAYLRHGYNRALDNRPAVRLAMGVFQRRLASSTVAVLRSFERRIAKIEETIDDLRSGRVTAAELRRRQRRLDREHREDFFDAHGADDDAREAGGGERHEGYEEAMLGALVAVTVEELQKEIDVLADLGERARRLVASGRESKFERLREVVEDPRHAGEKWIVFTEHRDTADYLVRRLEGFGYAGHVGQVHGGLGWPAREMEVERFRRPDGARFLVATDAAGEGINLQFCRLMVNYDIPWNPARLEQRMGRIHRYGQRHDVHVFNLVAGSTHEGRVLRVLLDKLDAIRRELRSDKVFDVIGRLFENRSLREHMAEALTDEGERRVVEHVDEPAHREPRRCGRGHRGARVRPARRGGRAPRPPAGGHGARALPAAPARLRPTLRPEERLLAGAGDPGRSRRPLLPGGRPGGGARCTPARARRPSTPGARAPVRPAARGRRAVRLAPPRRAGLRRVDGPGHEQVRPRRGARRHLHRPEGRGALPVPSRRGLRRGARRRPPSRAIAASSRERWTEGPGPGRRAGNGFAGSPPPPGRRERANGPAGPGREPIGRETADAAEPRLLERRLFGLRQNADGALSESPVEHLLLLHGAPEVAPGAVPLASQGVAMRVSAAAYAEQELSARMVEERRAALRAELPERRRRIGVGFDLRAAELAARRTKLAGRADAGGTETDDELQATKAEQRALSSERRHVLARTDAAPERLAPGEVRFLAHALVVPARASGALERYDARVEEIAVRIAAAWEQERGSAVRDVSTPGAARLAGLPDWPGFDLLATPPDGDVRNIEVKGRAGQSAVQLELNEWKQAFHLGDRYWLYVVFDCATPGPRLVRVRDPFRRLLAKSRESSAWVVSAQSLIDAAEQTP